MHQYRVEDHYGHQIGTAAVVDGDLFCSLPFAGEQQQELTEAITAAVAGGETSLTAAGKTYRLYEYLTREQVAGRLRAQEAEWAAERQAAIDSCADPDQAEVWIGSAVEPRLAAQRAKEIPGVLTVVAVQVYASSQAEADDRIQRWHAGDRSNPWNRN